MNETFRELTDKLEVKFQTLLRMRPHIAGSVPSEAPIGGVYLFSENGLHLYTGRTKRKISTRIRGHFSTANDCPFAWRLARESTGFLKASYKKEGSRKALLATAEFRASYEQAKVRIKTMEVRFVGEADPLRQALLEIYVAVVSGAKFNDFDTH
jgi:hypothetical protein